MMSLKYSDQFLFLIALLFIGLLFSKFFTVKENLTNKTNCRCKNIPMHWGWPRKNPPAHMIYGF